MSRRHEREEFAATALAAKAYGRVRFRHEREEFAHRLDTHRVSVHQQVASR